MWMCVGELAVRRKGGAGEDPQATTQHDGERRGPWAWIYYRTLRHRIGPSEVLNAIPKVRAPFPLQGLLSMVMPFPSAPLVLAALLLSAALLPGCDAGRTEDAVRFGDTYRVLEQISTPDGGMRDVAPHIDGDLLAVTVQYAGGCADHVFDVQARTVRDRGAPVVEVWLVHDDGGDQCEAAITDRRALPLPASVVEAPRAVLLTPGGTRYALR